MEGEREGGGERERRGGEEREKEGGGREGERGGGERENLISIHVHVESCDLRQCEICSSL